MPTFHQTYSLPIQTNPNTSSNNPSPPHQLTYIYYTHKYMKIKTHEHIPIGYVNQWIWTTGTRPFGHCYNRIRRSSSSSSSSSSPNIFFIHIRSRNLVWILFTYGIYDDILRPYVNSIPTINRYPSPYSLTVRECTCQIKNPTQWIHRNKHTKQGHMHTTNILHHTPPT